MKKKILVLVSALLIFSAANAFSWGIGGAFGLPLGDDVPGANALLSLKVDQFPFIMGIGFSIGQDTANFGFTADWHMIRQNLTGMLNWYAGPGLYVAYAGDTFHLGGRVPVALYIFPIDALELFVEVAPTLSAGLGDPITFPNFGIQSSFGFRFWFN